MGLSRPSVTTFTEPVMRSPMPLVEMVTSPRDGNSDRRVRAPKSVAYRFPMMSTNDPGSMSSPDVP